MNDFGLKELYEVQLKATCPIEINGRTIEIGETVAVFDKIQIANFQENRKFFTTGNTNSGESVWWEETKEVALSFSQGVFSKSQLALLTNAKLVHSNGTDLVKIHCHETVESDENGKAVLKHNIVAPMFAYKKTTGEKLYNLSIVGNILYTGEAYQELIVDYYYNYNNGYEKLTIGTPLTCGYLSLEGKTRVKDDITGQVKTGIIRIPKLKLLSNLSMRLGNDAVPQVGRLDAVAVPTGARGEKKVMEIIFLNDDIDSDM